jgi:catechol 2,3-dioxygenase-like lactoylglutathione lyase family enzyme
VFRQVVAHRWSPQADATARDGFRAAMESLRAVPELVALHHGDDAGHFPGNHDYVAVLDFPDFAAARRYVASPVHQAFVREHATSAVDCRVVVQHDWAVGAVSGLHHVKLPVRDVERSAEWYGRAFGFTCAWEAREDGELCGAALHHPDSELQLALRRDPDRAAALAGFDTLCLAVGTRRDLDAVLHRLDERGIDHGTPFPGRGGEAVDVPDPDGHLVRLHTLCFDLPTGQEPTMTLQSTTTLARRVSTAPPDSGHQHDRSCYWDAGECRWSCYTYPPVGYAFEHCTAIGRSVANTGPGTQP